MGVIDKTTHKFDCPQCGSTETVTILQKGSNWGASWESPPKSDSFSISWNNDRLGEPLPSSYKCLACGIDVLHEKW